MPIKGGRMNPDTENTGTQEPVVPPAQQPSLQPGNKKLIYGVLAGIAVLLIILIGLVVALLMKNDATPTNKATGSSEQTDTNTSDPTTLADKEVIKTVATENDKIELHIYKPRQTGSNTTIEFGLHNKCNGCEEGEFASVFSLLGYSINSDDDAYILDENAGKKYSLIVDADDNPLATKSCSNRVEPGKTFDCFAAFTKVPSGTTVSIILGDTKIDDILVE